MKHPIESWTLEQVETWRRQRICIGERISHVFTDADRLKAIRKLEELYPGNTRRGVYSAFAERIMVLSELY